jgi:crotonobetainyl-CoA:carnitine CoA-transferase CaiB-like acyl-CoA transferase
VIAATNQQSDSPVTEQVTALSGLRVLEVGGLVSAAYATRLLADLGADVVKVESPDGDETRRIGPFPGEMPHPERSGLFLHLNTNKRAVTLNLSETSGRRLLLELSREADVVIETLPLELSEKWELRPSDFHAANPDLIVTSLTRFGHTGPYRAHHGYDLTTGALGGICNYLGSVGRPLLAPPGHIVEYESGLNAAVATMIGLLADVGGQHIDISESDSWATIQNGMGVIEFIHGGRAFARIGRGVRGGPYPNAILPCKDGYVRAICIQRREWDQFLEVLGNPEWANDPRFQDRIKMNELYADELDGHLIEWMADKTKEEIFVLCQNAGVPFGPVNTIQEIVEDPAFESWFMEIDHPEVPRSRQVAPPFFLSATPATIRRPAPLLGQHNAEVLSSLGIGTEALGALRAGGII